MSDSEGRAKNYEWDKSYAQEFGEYHRQMRQSRRLFWAVVVTVLSIFAWLIYDSSNWSPYMWRSFLPRAKASIGLASESDQRELLLICNTLRRRDCSAKAALAMIAADPKNESAVANYGMSLAEQGNFKEALQYLDPLIKGGTNAIDVIYWYAASLAETGDVENAKQWYYIAINSYPKFVSSSKDLIRILFKEAKYAEALALIHSLREHSAQLGQYFSAFEAQAKMHLAKSQTQHQGELEIPLIGDGHFYLPVSFSHESEPKMFMVDSGATYLVVNDQILSTFNISLPPVVRKVTLAMAIGTVQAQVVKFGQVRIGSWDLRNVEAVYCAKCSPLLGMSVLSRFQWRKRDVVGGQKLHLKL